MQLTVKGKQLDVGDALRTHVETELTEITEKYFSNPIQASVVFTKTAHLYRTDIAVHVGRDIHMNAQAEADAPYAACDKAVEKIAKRLRRYKRRLRDHHRDVGSTGEVMAAHAYVLEAEPEAESDDYNEPDHPVIVAETPTDIETLTVPQAVMRLDLADLPALMFRNPKQGNLNMVYRRPDGNIGWVDPQVSGSQDTETAAK
ncbi:ribosome-associated translation inhibitor RaiA [Fodinicurvata sp. EGI_FJ10296]|uniref:ribosome hibernation-promoting factor, HPF/YfiA family n=1 Tax=Fodinicurvata sp. EGI_FJ10296 TaxID=3231908 RepID=UPI003451321B